MAQALRTALEQRERYEREQKAGYSPNIFAIEAETLKILERVKGEKGK